jgi:mannose-6-phosphate isomerase-like protein (cupin superfamily)
MADYVIKNLDEVGDVLGDYPGEMKMMTYDLNSEKVAFTWRRMPQHTGGKGSYGHFHKQAEEIYFVVEGSLQFKLGDEVIDVSDGSAVRVAPNTVRSIWNEGPDDAELVICSVRLDDPRADGEIVEEFWPD